MEHNSEKKQDLLSFKSVSEAQAKDTGMAMVLICLLISLFGQEYSFTIIATSLLVINMVFPKVYKPVAIIWLSLSHLIGTVMSKVLLTIVFILVVTPIGFIRRLIGKDTLKLKEWKQGRKSVFVDRKKRFDGKDIEVPY